MSNVGISKDLTLKHCNSAVPLRRVASLYIVGCLLLAVDPEEPSKAIWSLKQIKGRAVCIFELLVSTWYVYRYKYNKYIVFSHVCRKLLDPCIPVGIHAKYAPAALVECGIRAPWPWNIGSLSGAKNLALLATFASAARYPWTNPSAKVQLSAMIKIVTEVLFRSTWRFLIGDVLRKLMVQDHPGRKLGGCGRKMCWSLCLTGSFKTWCRFRIKSTSECPRWLYTFHHLWNPFHLANTSQGAEKKIRDTGRAGTAKNSRSARKVEAMSCSVTHASPVKGKNIPQEKCGSTVGYSWS